MHTTVWPCAYLVLTQLPLWRLFSITNMKPNLLSFQYRRTITERSFIYQIVGNATFSVDTFFFISGLLVVILFYRSAQKRMNTTNEKILNKSNYVTKTTYKISISILYRYIRLTPAYLFVILFNEIALK